MPMIFKNIEEYRDFQRNLGELQKLALYFADLKATKDQGLIALGVGSDVNREWQPPDAARIGFPGGDIQEIMNRTIDTIDYWGGVFNDHSIIIIQTNLQR